ncbi:MAG: 3-methyl-2-oxobutanoate hydroxymethyltransferase [Spirochaetes bacterium]|jgi:3-methyl-2-oxobutanoate hydroxymethyltransferase|nr:3-methyl-2-oxobutanoate hydroxymethyltransferase [Spirochaetota bacterium]
MTRKGMTVQAFREMKSAGEKISMVTCYDFSMARLVARSSVDVILVGDSSGMIHAGYDNTLPVTVDEMIYHSRSVKRGAPDSFIITDLPFLSYHVSKEDAIKNAGKLVKEGQANSVKLEGGAYFCDIISHLQACSIPVCGHLGMTPQSINSFGGFRIQGRTETDASRMIDDAKRIEDAGVFALVLELVPEELAARITEALEIPTIGIGAGVHCDGQVLVLNDILGMDDSFKPKMVKRYAELCTLIPEALSSYSRDVKSSAFPDAEHSFK